ncbi:MAG: ATP-dependent RecD-like DNA helicase [Clostridia bacterium]|nr:ATP-dependent RecD-like DNA helicase [Clostridia bacterium]
MDKLSGTVEEIRFRNDENGWTVFVIDSEGEPVTVAGTVPQITPGDFLELDGEFVIHPKFGTQFKASGASIAEPHTVYGIVRFLGSGLIEGVGEKTAARIVDKFGLDTLDVIEKTPARLAEIRGISAAKAEKISEGLSKLKHEREAIVFLTGYGISVGLALKLYAEYGANTVARVKENPYVLVEDISGVGFLTADRIAQSIGIEKTSEFRMRAGLLHALHTACEKEGNTYLTRERLMSDAEKLLVTYDADALDAALDGLLVSRKVVVPFDGAVMGETYFRTERAVAAKMVKRMDCAGVVANDVTGIIDRFEAQHGFKLHELQRAAVVTAVTSGASVITGGPGTGKTTIIDCVLFVLDALGQTATLLAPTGRAAKRITEGCGRDASTIHREILGMADGECIGTNAVIVDEFSMVDIFLFRMLLDKMREDTKLVIVGDADQLPSVGPGNVLRDLIASGLVPVTRLSFIYRQAETSRIAVSAHDINAGRLPELTAKDGDFFFFRTRTPQATADMTTELVTTRITGFCGIDPSRIQVIAALKNGPCGVNALNNRLQSALNGNSPRKVAVGDITFAEGDRVMHTVNNYELEWRRGAASGTGVFNGDIGTVTHVHPTGEIEVEFEDGRIVTYGADIRGQLILSYAVTVHKSQGCEFDAIVMPIVGGAPVIMTRNLLYTAITRAKKMAVLVGDEYNVKRMVDNNYVADRFSALATFIVDAKKNMTKLFGDA